MNRTNRLGGRVFPGRPRRPVAFTKDGQVTEYPCLADAARAQGGLLGSITYAIRVGRMHRGGYWHYVKKEETCS